MYSEGDTVYFKRTNQKFFVESLHWAGYVVIRRTKHMGWVKIRIGKYSPNLIPKENLLTEKSWTSK